MQSVVTISLSYEEFTNAISEAIRKELKQVAPPPRQEDTPGPDGGAYVNKRQAARLLSCSVSTVDNLRRAKQLRAFYVGKAVRFSRAEVLAQARGHSSTKQRIKQ